MQKTVTFFFIADYSKSAWQSKEKNSAFLQKNYGIFVKMLEVRSFCRKSIKREKQNFHIKRKKTKRMTIYKKKQIRYTERKRLDENRPEYKGGSANGKASGTYRAGGGGAYPKRSGKQDGKSYGENE